MWRALSGLIVLASISAAAAQDAPPENGIGPYHFGMNVAQIEATSQRAEWRVQAAPDDGQMLTGGPPIQLDAGRFQTSLVFEHDALRYIVLTGSATSACATAMPALIAQLEPTFGAFNAAAGPRENILLSAVMYTPDGSEIRTGDANGETVLTSTRRGAMFIEVTGRSAAANAQACQISIAFNAQAPHSILPADSVTYAELDHAQTLVHFLFTERPGVEDFSTNYPRGAMYAGIEGRVVLNCLVGPDGRLRCLVEGETPMNRGFGPAALRIAHAFRVARTDDGTPTQGKRLLVPVTFRLMN